MGKIKRISTDISPRELREPHALPAPSFAALLRRFRRASGLTQEELAERASISARTLSDLERELVQRPQRETLRLLVDALELGPQDRALFEAAARQRRPADAQSSSLRTIPTNLPISPTPILGRTADIATAAALLRRGDLRLLTITGPGGIGKTRLALALATAAHEGFPDGVFFVPLASVRDPGLIISAIAQALGVQESVGRPLGEIVRAYLEPRSLLLVLDNFEQIIPAGAAVADLLAACPTLTALITSRAALQVQGEQEYAVGPLALPDVRQERDMRSVARSPSVRLFVQRAQTIRPAFRLTEANVVAVAEICARLDGLPLAIELAAARLRLLTPEELRTRLVRRLPLLTSQAQDRPVRQQTMRDTIAWSYELLPPRVQQIFRRLAVFAGGCSLAAAERVCARGDDTPITVLEGIEALVHGSLLQTADEPDGTMRLTMLETIREYGWELLEALGELDAMQTTHAAYFLALAEEAEPRLTGPEQRTWLTRLAAEHDNCRAALAWLREQGAVEDGLRLAAALWRFLHTQGHTSEGRAWLEDFLARMPGTPSERHVSIWAKALYGAGVLATEQGAYGRAIALIEEALPTLESRGDPVAVAGLLNILGAVARYQGDYERSMTRYAESLERYRTANDQRGAAIALNNMGTVAGAQGDHPLAMRLLAESLALKRQLGDARGVGVTLFNMGDIARNLGEYARATTLLEEAIAILRELGDKPGLAYALNNLGDVARDQQDGARAGAYYAEGLALFRAQGDQSSIARILHHLGDVARIEGNLSEAAAHYLESLALCRDIGHTTGVMEGIEGFAQLAAARGAREDAVRLFSTAAVQREARSTPLAPADRSLVDISLVALRMALSETAFAAAWESGRNAPLEEAVSELLTPSSPPIV